MLADVAHPDLVAFREKFRTEALVVHRTASWTWSVRPVHTTLGAGILSLSRYAASMADLATEETAELATMARVIEGSLRVAFAFDKINYLMLMMNDPHVHYHVMPRYASARTFAETTWTDTGWPALPALAGEPADDAVLARVRDTLRDAVASISASR